MASTANCGPAPSSCCAGAVVRLRDGAGCRAGDRRRRAAAAAAALAERERLARTIHDGVLQVLGLTHRPGRGADGDLGRLARPAAEQESALRALITSRPEPTAGRDRPGRRACGPCAASGSAWPRRPSRCRWRRAGHRADRGGAGRAAQRRPARRAGRPGLGAAGGRRRRPSRHRPRRRRRIRSRPPRAGRGRGSPGGLASIHGRARELGGRASDHSARREKARSSARRCRRRPRSGAVVTRVVLVDDHPIWRDAVERDLTAAGFEVVGSFDAAEPAIRTAPALRPDVVLMDLQLPGLSGVDAAAQLVAADPSVRILMFSASGEDADVLAAVKAGARGYLVKSAPQRRTRRGGRPHRAGRRRVLPRPRRAGAGRVPTHRPQRTRPGRGAHRTRDRDPAPGRPPAAPPARSPKSWCSRTGRCRTTSRTRCASCNCTTGSSSPAGRSSTA